ncbi:hypothetical protein BJ742DRAFT_383580 [Cladochytrium replicatum]|nr:hypothetical protein BJ742DRAFT_383580 [Cladochytrium replicatum]
MANSGSTRKDVLQFLEELDQLTVPELKSTSPNSAKPVTTTATSTKTNSSSVADDVLSFLDEIAGTPPANAVQSIKNSNDSAPHSTPQSPSPHFIKPDPPSAGGLFTPQSPAKAPTPVSPPTNPPMETYTHFTQSNPSVPQAVSPIPNEGAWGWDKLWTTATAATAKVSAVTSASLTKGLETVRQVAEETGKAVAASSSSAAESAVVKKLMADVSANREKIGKFGSEITTLTKGLVDTIAPPITEQTSHDGHRGPGGPPSIFSGPLTVWICAETLYGENLDTLHDFLQAVANEWWLSIPSSVLKNEVGLCSNVLVNSVKDPDPKPAASYAEAMKNAEHIAERLQKLHAINSTPEKPNESQVDAHAAKEHAVFMVAQPFLQELKTPWEVQLHLQYLVFVVHPLPNDTTDAPSGHTVVLSQSIAYRPAPASTAPVTFEETPNPEGAPSTARPGVVAMLSGVLDSVAGNIGHRRGAERFAGGYARWNEGQRARVLECAIADACEEFAAKCYQVAKEKPSREDPGNN